MMPKVFNKRTDKIPRGAVYVGRPSKWGNPFTIGAQAPYPYLKGQLITRELSLSLFRDYLKVHPELVSTAKIELRGKDLVCWCAPLPCHADIWLELANK